MKITITDSGGKWWVALEDDGSIFPTTSYETPMAACARVLQLLDLDMVASQPHPEAVCIGTINGKPL